MSFAFRKKDNQKNPSLEELRAGIDKVDQQLFVLLKERAKLVFAVGEYKRARQLPIYDPSRESVIRRKVREAAGGEGPLSPSEMESLFMGLVEKFRFLEGAHVQRALANSLSPQAHLKVSGNQNVTLVGFGLLGASVYLALNEVFPQWHFEVIDPGVTVSSFLQWKEDNQFSNIQLVDEGHMHPASIFVLAASVDVNAEYLMNFPFSTGALVFDLGSTKQEMMKAFQKRQEKKQTDFIFMGGHPLAGKEVSGFQNADAMLFYNKVFCWTAPETQLLNEKIKATCDVLALAMGAMPYWTQARKHDQALAWTSHLPQILSCVIAASLKDKDFSQNPEFFPGVISDLLRVSGSSFSIWESILKSNQKALHDTIEDVLEKFKALQAEVKSGNTNQSLFQDANDFYYQFQMLKNKKGAS